MSLLSFFLEKLIIFYTYAKICLLRSRLLITPQTIPSQIIFVNCADENRFRYLYTHVYVEFAGDVKMAQFSLIVIFASA